MDQVQHSCERLLPKGNSVQFGDGPAAVTGTNVATRHWPEDAGKAQPVEGTGSQKTCLIIICVSRGKGKIKETRANRASPDQAV